MRWLPAIGFTLALIGGPAVAAPHTGALSPGEMDAMSSLFSGYAGALACNMRVDTAVAAKFLTRRLGSAPYSATQVAQAAMLLTGLVAMHQEIPMDCNVVRGAFGPRGTDIPGLLK